MTKQLYITILLPCLLTLSAGDRSMADEADEAEEVWEQKTQRCISTRTLKSTRIVDDQNVLFFKAGRTVYHNILPKQCKGLARYGQFTYGTLAGSICERDAIRVIDNNSGVPGRTCLLGIFYKITKDDIPAIFERRYRPVESQPIAIPEVEDITEGIGEPRDPEPN